MSHFIYTLSKNQETNGRSLTVTFFDGKVFTFGPTHPSTNEAVKLTLSTDTTFDEVTAEGGEVTADDIASFQSKLADLQKVRQAIGTKLQQVCGDVTFDGEHIYFQNEHIDSSMSKFLLALLREDNPKWKSVGKFFDKVMRNPSTESVKSLFDWINDRNFTITQDGNFIAYKGVRIDEDGVSRSIHAGPGVVDGVVMNGHLPNREGSTVEMARNDVNSDTNVGCSVGLHAGTWEYAHGFAQGRVVKVEIDPANVVSVPSDCHFQKLRVWKYLVLEEVEAPETVPVVRDYDESDYDEDNDWGDDDGWDDDGWDEDDLDDEDFDEDDDLDEDEVAVIPGLREALNAPHAQDETEGDLRGALHDVTHDSAPAPDETGEQDGHDLSSISIKFEI